MNTSNRCAAIALRSLGLLLAPRRVPPIPESPRGILVVRQHDQLGDMLCVLPTLRTLRERYPGAEITLVASPVNHDPMAGHPWLGSLLLYDKRAGLLGREGGVRGFLRRLRSRRYDIAIVPSTVSISLTSGVIAWLSRAPVRIGPGRLEHRENPGKFLFTHPVDLDWSGSPARHQALRNADILAPLGLECAAGPSPLAVSPAEDARAAALLAPLRSGHPRLFGIHPGAAKAGNRWPAERFADLAKRLHAGYGNALVVTVGPRDEEVAGRLLPLLEVPHLVIRNEPIRSVAAVINRLDFFVSNDTGPLHIAGALAPPVLGLFGPTDPKQWAPLGRKNHHIASKDGTIGSLTTDEVFRMCAVIISLGGREPGRTD